MPHSIAAQIYILNKYSVSTYSDYILVSTKEYSLYQLNGAPDGIVRLILNQWAEGVYPLNTPSLIIYVENLSENSFDKLHDFSMNTLLIRRKGGWVYRSMRQVLGVYQYENFLVYRWANWATKGQGALSLDQEICR